MCPTMLLLRAKLAASLQGLTALLLLRWPGQRGSILEHSADTIIRSSDEDLRQTGCIKEYTVY